ncbi:protein serine/threonine phosphatase 2C [Epithele typhae]|uniref:protein serine/threonine phosphatase 2C n=1 Tax=Epithele typhae TaxID=378194 RepID=UPI0020080DA2|nr:protein serine/threonine phosphatase 2C [Epithele typhae]KAH9915286.1 protein serine/threonine phosphatase 2C [Epithele typhae]
MLKRAPLARRPRRAAVALPRLLALWGGALSCISNAAVSLEGEIGRRVDVDRELRRHETSVRPPPGSGIARYDCACVASNQPAEDEHAEAVLPVPSGHWSFFGLFDGHNGGETSKWLADNLTLAVAGALADLYSRLAAATGGTPDPTPAEIQETIRAAFAAVDEHIVHDGLATALALSAAARTEDAARVLAPAHPGEVARLTAAHPGEPLLLQHGRVLGMGVSRAFGDARLKWPRAAQQELRRRGLARGAALPEVRTPPYVHAAPEVVSVPVRAGDFLVLGSDGLWEALTNEEAVGLVGMWRDARAAGGKEGRKGRVRDPVGGHAPHVLPVWASDAPDMTVRYRQWSADKRFSCADENAATMLLRNALGGADRELTSALLTIKSPRTRAYRDDMTAVVVFFDDDDDGA